MYLESYWQYSCSGGLISLHTIWRRLVPVICHILLFHKVIFNRRRFADVPTTVRQGLRSACQTCTRLFLSCPECEIGGDRYSAKSCATRSAPSHLVECKRILSAGFAKSSSIIHRSTIHRNLSGDHSTSGFGLDADCGEPAPHIRGDNSGED